MSTLGGWGGWGGWGGSGPSGPAGSDGGPLLAEALTQNRAALVGPFTGATLPFKLPSPLDEAGRLAEWDVQQRLQTCAAAGCGSCWPPATATRHGLMPTSRSRLRAAAARPGAATPGWTGTGDSGQACCALIYPRSVATDDNGTCARQSHFEDADYDIEASVDSPSNPTLIRRSGSFNSIATGERTASVGATRMSHTTAVPGIPDPKWARYSPRQPDPDRTRPERPGVVKIPRAEAYGDENPVLEGVTGAGTRSGGMVRLRGTSAASPQVTRQLFNASGKRRP